MYHYNGKLFSSREELITYINSESKGDQIHYQVQNQSPAPKHYDQQSVRSQYDSPSQRTYSPSTTESQQTVYKGYGCIQSQQQSQTDNTCTQTQSKLKKSTTTTVTTTYRCPLCSDESSETLDALTSHLNSAHSVGAIHADSENGQKQRAELRRISQELETETEALQQQIEKDNKEKTQQAMLNQSKKRQSIDESRQILVQTDEKTGEAKTIVKNKETGKTEKVIDQTTIDFLLNVGRDSGKESDEEIFVKDQASMNEGQSTNTMVQQNQNNTVSDSIDDNNSKQDCKDKISSAETTTVTNLETDIQSSDSGAQDSETYGMDISLYSKSQKSWIQDLNQTYFRALLQDIGRRLVSMSKSYHSRLKLLEILGARRAFEYFQISVDDMLRLIEHEHPSSEYRQYFKLVMECVQLSELDQQSQSNNHNHNDSESIFQISESNLDHLLSSLDSSLDNSLDKEESQQVQLLIPIKTNLDKTYKQLARKLHPDKNGSTDEAKENFQHLKKMYDAGKKAVGEGKKVYYEEPGWQNLEAANTIFNRNLDNDLNAIIINQVMYKLFNCSFSICNLPGLLFDFLREELKSRLKNAIENYKNEPGNRGDGINHYGAVHGHQYNRGSHAAQGNDSGDSSDAPGNYQQQGQLNDSENVDNQQYFDTQTSSTEDGNHTQGDDFDSNQYHEGNSQNGDPVADSKQNDLDDSEEQTNSKKKTQSSSSEGVISYDPTDRHSMQKALDRMVKQMRNIKDKSETLNKDVERAEAEYKCTSENKSQQGGNPQYQ